MRRDQNLTRRRFLRLGAGAAALGSGAAPAFDLNEFLRDARPLLESAQPLIESYLLGEAQEVQLGRTYFEPYLKESGGLHTDWSSQTALRRFAEPYVATSERDAFDWEVVLVDNDTINAWALPGGKIAVHSGVVRHAAHPAELGSVIAHEIGHAELSHGLQQMRTQAFVQTMSTAGKRALAGAGDAGVLTAQALGALEGPVFQMITSGYARKREFEADAHILKVFRQTGDDPARADDFFRTLQRVTPRGSSLTTSLFSTHPGTEARIERIERLASLRRSPPRRNDPSAWRELKARFPTP